MLKYKPIQFRTDKWQEIRDLADEITLQRGAGWSMASTVMEAIKFYKENKGVPNVPKNNRKS